jgi:phosphate transport system protein
MERQHFEAERQGLRNQLLTMGALVEDRVHRAIQALINRREEEAQRIIATDQEINDLQIDIDDRCLKLLALQTPLAVDLRLITSAMKINADLERVGDQAVNIAERVMDMIELPAVDLPVDIARMATAASAMVRRALESFVEGKAELAQAVLEMDHVVDRMRDEAFIMLVRKMNEEPQVTQQALDALLVARNLERVADHATNIAEDVIFWVLGADVRHHAQAASAAPRPERREQI